MLNIEDVDINIDILIEFVSESFSEKQEEEFSLRE